MSPVADRVCSFILGCMVPSPVAEDVGFLCPHTIPWGCHHDFTLTPTKDLYTADSFFTNTGNPEKRVCLTSLDASHSVPIDYTVVVFDAPSSAPDPGSRRPRGGRPDYHEKDQYYCRRPRTKQQGPYFQVQVITIETKSPRAAASLTTKQHQTPIAERSRDRESQRVHTHTHTKCSPYTAHCPRSSSCYCSCQPQRAPPAAQSATARGRTRQRRRCSLKGGRCRYSPDSRRGLGRCSSPIYR